MNVEPAPDADMAEQAPLLFAREGHDLWKPAPQARGPWEGVQGGAAGALMCAVAEEEVTPDYRASAVTVHLFRPVPMGELRTVRRLVHRGRRSAVCDIYIGDPEKPFARASVVFTTAADTPRVPLPEPATAGLPALQRWPNYLSPHGQPWHDEAMEKAVGPDGVLWFKSRWRVIGSESSFCRVLPLADWSSGLSRPDDWRNPAVRALPNVEYTLHADRHPDDDWIRLDAKARWSREGVALATTALDDAVGAFGRFTTTIVLVP